MMAKTLIDDFWLNRRVDLPGLWEEIEVIDRVISLRLAGATKAYAAGLIFQPADVGGLVDDLIYRRRLFMDLITCLSWEEQFTAREAAILRHGTKRLGRNHRCKRFPGDA
jgi:hypothetical protein